VTSPERDRPALQPADLTLIERTYLGVLDTGMVPVQLAGDPTLRMDYVSAVCHALRQGLADGAFLAGDAAPDAAFLLELTAAVQRLDERGVISIAPPPPDAVLSPDAPRRAPPAVVDFDQHPRIWDRYLAHACLEELFGDPRVYPFLMGKYQDSGEVWARLYKERPERFL
jgi:hypothetical protein